eukprot:364795-Chlamydomonas_euryale.AAC.26
MKRLVHPHDRPRGVAQAALRGDGRGGGVGGSGEEGGRVLVEMVWGAGWGLRCLSACLSVCLSAYTSLAPSLPLSFAAFPPSLLISPPPCLCRTLELSGRTSEERREGKRERERRVLDEWVEKMKMTRFV